MDWGPLEKTPHTKKRNGRQMLARANEQLSHGPLLVGMMQTSSGRALSAVSTMIAPKRLHPVFFEPTPIRTSPNANAGETDGNSCF